MSVMKAVALTAVLTIVGLGLAHSQSNEVVDRVLQQEALTSAEAVYLIQVAAGNAQEATSVDQVYQSFDWSSVGLEPKAADEPLTLGEFSFLLMQSLDMSGGIMYSLLPSPRYAARELHYLGHISGNRSPYRDVAGNEALRILGSVLRAQQS